MKKVPVLTLYLMGEEGVPARPPFFEHVSTSFGMMALPYLQEYP